MADSGSNNAVGDVRILILEDNPADKDLLEYELPYLTGRGALQIGKKTCPDTLHLPVILVVTGAVGEERASRSLRPGIHNKL